MNVDYDMRQVVRYASALPAASAAVVVPLGAVVKSAAVGIEKDLRVKAGGHSRFAYLPAAITHDVRGLSAEIGPDKNRRGGAIGNIVYFGTRHNGPVLEHPSAALARATPGFEAAVATAAGRGLSAALP